VEHLPIGWNPPATMAVDASAWIRQVGDASVASDRTVVKHSGKGTPQMSKWNFTAMGQAGLTGWTKQVAEPIAHTISRRTGRPEGQILALIGAAFLAITMIDFLRNVDAVIAAGRVIPRSASDDPTAKA
jgi:hypothetical protein